MSEAKEKSGADKASAAKASSAPGAGASAARSWRDVWQVPVGLLASGLLVAGLATAVANRPKPDPRPALAEAAELLDADEFEDALGVLNTKVLALVDRGYLEREQLREFYLLRARALARGQRALGVSTEENNENIVGQFTEAEGLGARLEPGDVSLLASSLVALGRLEAAQERADALPPESRAVRADLYREMVDHLLAQRPPDRDGALALISRLVADPETGLDDRAWAAARQAEVLLETGYAADAIARLLRVTPRLEGADPLLLGEVHLRLGQAYLETNAIVEAGRQFERAGALIPGSALLAADVGLARARVAEYRGDAATARDLYQSVLQSFGTTHAAREALLGLGETEAALGDTEASLAAFARLAEALRAPAPSAEHAGGHGEGHDEAHAGAKSDAHGEDGHGAATEKGAEDSAKAGAEGADHAAPAGRDAHGKDAAHADAKDAPAEGHGAEGAHGDAASGDAEVAAARRDGPPSPSGARAELERERAGRAMLARSRDRFDAGDLDAALRYANLAESLYSLESTPPELVLALARTHLRLAEEMVRGSAGSSTPASDVDAGGAGEEGGQGSEPGGESGHGGAGEQHTEGAEGGEAAAPRDGLDAFAADPATRALAQPHFIAAGDYFRRYATKVVLTDTGAYGNALWAAGDAFDRGGDRDSSIAAFQEYVESFPGDLRQPEAKYRLARAYQSRGDLELAAALYRELIAGRGDGSSGPFGDASYVPLSQVLLGDADAGNDDEAERLLGSVVGGGVGGAGTPFFRAALLELAGLHARRGEHERAAERYEEALARAPDAPDATLTRASLADAYRLSAEGIALSLREAMPDARRRELEGTRAERLEKAAALYALVRDGLEARDARRRSVLEDLTLRNSYFYLGACAFDLGRYEEAIRHYDAARERYPGDPTTLVAMTQVVSAHLRMGDKRRAATANERARRFFESLPAEVWDDPALPMGRADWERWLEASATLSSAAEAGAGEGAEEAGGRSAGAGEGSER